jgi:hypothetical protein
MFEAANCYSFSEKPAINSHGGAGQIVPFFRKTGNA